jgi:hypothetical protein
MSSEQATEQLAALQATYDPPLVGPHASTPTEAAQRLVQLGQTPDFLRRLEKGDIAAKEEWSRLSELKAAASPAEMTAEPIMETTAGEAGLTRRDLVSVAADMAAEGIPDRAISFILADNKFSPEDVYVAQYWHDLMERDENAFYPGLPQDRGYQLMVFNIINSIGTGDWS